VINTKKHFITNSYRWGLTMIEQINLGKQDQEMETLGRAFIGFLMAMGVICGLWFASGLLVVFTKMMT
jgi:hypothetical protein